MHSDHSKEEGDRERERNGGERERERRGERERESKKNERERESQSESESESESEGARGRERKRERERCDVIRPLDGRVVLVQRLPISASLPMFLAFISLCSCELSQEGSRQPLAKFAIAIRDLWPTALY